MFLFGGNEEACNNKTLAGIPGLTSAMFSQDGVLWDTESLNRLSRDWKSSKDSLLWTEKGLRITFL